LGAALKVKGVEWRGVARRDVIRHNVERPDDVTGGAPGGGVRLGVADVDGGVTGGAPGGGVRLVAEDVDGDIPRGAIGVGVGDVGPSTKATDAKVDVEAVGGGVDAAHADKSLEDGADCAFFRRLSIKRFSADKLN
jgi:hypothetical protein